MAQRQRLCRGENEKYENELETSKWTGWKCLENGPRRFSHVILGVMICASTIGPGHRLGKKIWSM